MEKFNQNTNYVTKEVKGAFDNHIDKFDYAQGTLKLRKGGLNYLYYYHGKTKMDQLIESNNTEESINWLKDNAEKGSLDTGDIHSFKLAWEAIHGVEVFRKNVKRKLV